MSEISKNEEFEIVRNNLTSITALRKFINAQETEWVETFFEKIEVLIIEKREEIELQKLEAEEKAKNRQAAIEYLKEKFGIDDITDLMDESENSGKKRKKRATRPSVIKYRFTDKEGVEHSWTGQGRHPKALKELMNEGHSLEEYLVEKGEQQ